MAGKTPTRPLGLPYQVQKLPAKGGPTDGHMGSESEGPCTLGSREPLETALVRGLSDPREKSPHNESMGRGGPLPHIGRVAPGGDREGSVAPCPPLPEPLGALGCARSWWGDPQQGSQLGARRSLALILSSSAAQADGPLSDPRLSSPAGSRELPHGRWADPQAPSPPEGPAPWGPSPYRQHGGRPRGLTYLAGARRPGPRLEGLGLRRFRPPCARQG